MDSGFSSIEANQQVYDKNVKYSSSINSVIDIAGITGNNKNLSNIKRLKILVKSKKFDLTKVKTLDFTKINYFRIDSLITKAKKTFLHL